jgi:hypothetical protein
MTGSQNLESKLAACLRLIELERESILSAIAYLRYLLKTAENEESKERYRKLLREWQSDMRVCEIAMVALREIVERVRGYIPEPSEYFQLPENLQQIKDYAKKAKYRKTNPAAD